jgi:hypothetical protein
MVAMESWVGWLNALKKKCREKQGKVCEMAEQAKLDCRRPAVHDSPNGRLVLLLREGE